ncbi:MAG: helix-turn-helix transcriptional regulator [Spirochaetes bacterium]|nr:helix-turn-helix transcriptional regulator [Spirochaetota bacterium]
MRVIKYFRHYPSGNERCYIRALGLNERMPPALIDRPKGKDDYLFMYFYDPVTVQAGGEIKHDTKGFLIIWPPGERHYYGNPTARWLHSWMHCDGSVIGHYLSESAVALNSMLPLLHPAVFERYIAALYQEITAYRTEDTVITENLFHNMVRELSRELRGSAESGFIPENVQRVREHIESHYTQTMAIADLSAMANLTPAHFGTVYKRHVGLAPVEHIIELRMLEASTLLANRNMKIGEVASAVGYDDIYHFSKLFKKRFGVNPRAYRNK